MWIVGVLCYELSAGYAPFESETPSETCRLVGTVEYRLPVHVSFRARNLIPKVNTSTTFFAVFMPPLMRFPIAVISKTSGLSPSFKGYYEASLDKPYTLAESDVQH